MKVILTYPSFGQIVDKEAEATRVRLLSDETRLSVLVEKGGWFEIKIEKNPLLAAFIQTQLLGEMIPGATYALPETRVEGKYSINELFAATARVALERYKSDAMTLEQATDLVCAAMLKAVENAVFELVGDGKLLHPKE